MFDGRIGLTHHPSLAPRRRSRSDQVPAIRADPPQTPLVLLIFTDRRCSTRPLLHVAPPIAALTARELRCSGVAGLALHPRIPGGRDPCPPRHRYATSSRRPFTGTANRRGSSSRGHRDASASSSDLEDPGFELEGSCTNPLFPVRRPPRRGRPSDPLQRDTVQGR